jgi:hypothetical protein
MRGDARNYVADGSDGAVLIGSSRQGAHIRPRAMPLICVNA